MLKAPALLSLLTPFHSLLEVVLDLSLYLAAFDRAGQNHTARTRKTE